MHNNKLLDKLNMLNFVYRMNAFNLAQSSDNRFITTASIQFASKNMYLVHCWICTKCDHKRFFFTHRFVKHLILTRETQSEKQRINEWESILLANIEPTEWHADSESIYAILCSEILSFGWLDWQTPKMKVNWGDEKWW